MLRIQTDVRVPDLVKSWEQSLYDAKLYALLNVHHTLNAYQKQGKFPKDEEDYTLFLKSFGRREQRRQLATVRPQYFRIGTQRSPTTFHFVARTGSSLVMTAVSDAMRMAVNRAPVDRGEYRKSLTLRVKDIRDKGASVWVKVSYVQLKNMEITKNTVIQIVPEIVRQSKAYPAGFPYGVAIEYGFYKRYYKTRQLRGGILHHVAVKLQKKFDRKVAIRFRYINYGGRGTFPGIEIGAPGAFISRNTRPGAGKAKKERAAKRRAARSG